VPVDRRTGRPNKGKLPFTHIYTHTYTRHSLYCKQLTEGTVVAIVVSSAGYTVSTLVYRDTHLVLCFQYVQLSSIKLESCLLEAAGGSSL